MTDFSQVKVGDNLIAVFLPKDDEGEVQRQSAVVIDAKTMYITCQVEGRGRIAFYTEAGDCTQGPEYGYLELVQAGTMGHLT